MCVCVCSHSITPDSATLWTVAPPDSPVHAVSQTIILQWVVISSSRGSSRSRDQIHIPCIFCIGGQILYTVSPGHTLTVPIFSGIIKLQLDEWCWFAECELTCKPFFSQRGKGRDWTRIESRGPPTCSSGWWLRLCTATLCVLSCSCPVQLFATLRTVAHQAPLSMRFSRQEYWSGLPFPTPGDLPNPGIKA